FREKSVVVNPRLVKKEWIESSLLFACSSRTIRIVLSGKCCTATDFQSKDVCVFICFRRETELTVISVSGRQASVLLINTTGCSGEKKVDIETVCCCFSIRKKE